MASSSAAPVTDNALDIVERSMAENGPRSAARITNQVFQDFTGIDSYDLPGLLLRGEEVSELTGAKHLRDQLATLLDCRRVDAGTLLGASESRFSRNDNLDRDVLDRAHAIIDTYVHVAAAIGPPNATRWFKTPHPALDDQPPSRLLKTQYGRNLVNDLVEALLAGTYV